MKIMVVGGGGREHAIIKKIKENPQVDVIYALPGNGGIAADAQCVPIGAKELQKIVDFAVTHAIDFAVVAPDDPLVMGLVDLLEEKGIPAFGPRKNAAIIEGSKAFAKDLMRRYGIPTAAYETFSDPEAALEYVRGQKLPIVVKADGLALGKGVLICQTHEEAAEAIRSIMSERIFGESGAKVVIEEFLSGPEVSVLAFTDGTCVAPMVSSMDHKRAHDHDEGLNTGGMGAVAPNPFYTAEVAERCMKEIFLPTMRAMNAEGRTFRGCLYFGLMLTADGPKVIEYNCRFGDPETQVVLPLMKSDLLTVMRAVRDGRLSETPVEFAPGAACCVIVASGGYPLHYEKGMEVNLGKAAELPDTRIFHAGTALADGRLVTSGGRVLGVTAVGDTLREAVRRAYRGVEEISFEGAFYRHDIGQRALKGGN